MCAIVVNLGPWRGPDTTRLEPWPFAAVRAIWGEIFLNPATSTLSASVHINDQHRQGGLPFPRNCPASIARHMRAYHARLSAAADHFFGRRCHAWQFESCTSHGIACRLQQLLACTLGFTFHAFTPILSFWRALALRCSHKRGRHCSWSKASQA